MRLATDKPSKFKHSQILFVHERVLTWGDLKNFKYMFIFLFKLLSISLLCLPTAWFNIY